MEGALEQEGLKLSSVVWEHFGGAVYLILTLALTNYSWLHSTRYPCPIHRRSVRTISLCNIVHRYITLCTLSFSLGLAEENELYCSEPSYAFASSLTPEDRKSITDECWRKARKKGGKGHADMNESLYTLYVGGTYPCCSSVEYSAALKRGSPRSSSTSTSTLAGCMCSIIGTSCALSSPPISSTQMEGCVLGPRKLLRSLRGSQGWLPSSFPILEREPPGNYIPPPSSTLLSSRHPPDEATK